MGDTYNLAEGKVGRLCEYSVLTLGVVCYNLTAQHYLVESLTRENLSAIKPMPVAKEGASRFLIQKICN